MEPTSDRVRHNEALRRFELALDGGTALTEYSLSNGVAIFHHTETPSALRGQGVASELIRGALTEARARGWKVRATCSYVAAYLKRHPEFADLIEP